MLIDDINFNVEEFKKVFRKKFDNFCKKAPILMSYIITDDKVTLFKHDDTEESKKLFIYSFDYQKNVKENIKDIKDTLLGKHYPILVETIVEQEDYTAEELNQLVSEGKISLDDVDVAHKENKKTSRWRIERVIILRDEIFLRNLETNRIFRYRMKVPVTLFLKKMRNNFTVEESWEYFTNKSILINEIYENYNEEESN